MLELLHIENIAVIESADIQFQCGFNALTGETGAGKSIVIDALGAALGGRVSRDLVRTGARRALVSAMFVDVPGDSIGLRECGVEPDEDGVLSLQREISAAGKSICRINGRPVTVSQLRRIGGGLLNIHGQHDGVLLLDEEQHGLYLDRFGRVDAFLKAYRREYRTLYALREQIRALRMDEAERARRVDTLRYQIDELERAELVAGEETELERRRELLRSGEKYMDALARAAFAMNGDDEVNGSVSAIREAEQALESVQALDDDCREIYQRLISLRCEAEDLGELLREKRDAFDFSPAELDAVESRSDLLYRLGKKYGGSTAEMLSYLAQRRAELDTIESAEDTLIQLNVREKETRQRVLQAAAALREARKKAALELEARIQSELQDLDMSRTRFIVEFTEKSPAPNGCDNIRFLMSANPGEAPRPIAKIASGGELARIMLAVKNVLAEQETVGTLVFDEVDTGVSGRAAQKVAEKLAQVSRRKQVLCVTHLPQLAAMADVHFSVEKGGEHGRVYTKVVELDRERRVAELARITGGASITDALLVSAGELLDGAERYRARLA